MTEVMLKLPARSFFRPGKHEPWISYERTVEQIEPHCESPIEVLFGAAMVCVARSRFAGPKRFTWCLPYEEGKLWSQYGSLLMPQYKWNGYRVDWAFRIRATYNNGTQSEACVFVECDGHDFHERTKEQAEHDRSKDRAIQASGIPIMRFTGRELHRDARQCADETLQVAEDRVLGRI